MDIRNVQKTGDMFYLYLPTRWCKKFHIHGKSKVGVQISADGALNVYPQASTTKPIKLAVKAQGDDLVSLHKLIVACYISPAESFKISLDKEIDFTKLLDQKNLVSLELVEIDGKQITCESSLHVSDPLSLLTTMIRKIKNFLHVSLKDAPRALLEKYEEEIDRSKLLIEKSVISSLVNPTKSSHKSIELHFMSLISTGLERIGDHLLALKNPPKKFIDSLSSVLGELGGLVKDDCKSLSIHNALRFLSLIAEVQDRHTKDHANYEVRRSMRALNNISEVVIDWAVIKECER
jgi:phosphate uptake regulator